MVAASGHQRHYYVRLPAGRQLISTCLYLPVGTHGLVVVATLPSHHDFCSTVRGLHRAGLATAQVELMDRREASRLGHSLDVRLLANRLDCLVSMLQDEPETRELPMGILAAGPVAASALLSASRCPTAIEAVVSYAGQPDVAFDALADVQASCRFIVPRGDHLTIRRNQLALKLLAGDRDLALFANPWEGSLLVQDWFERYLHL
ncbi:MAG: hypothetical protein KatS3mg105_1406 [Gemmatales bacterium]|nr:MAG: hypothetical protein KatS3mg105_1406 [Gemmatales bacterium]